MNVYRLLFLVAVCITCVILQAKSEENPEAGELNEEFEGPNIREKRHASYRRRYRYPRYRYNRYPRYRYNRYGRCGYWFCKKLKEVDCRENILCQLYQKCCFGKVFKPPTPTPPMMSTSTPVVSVTPVASTPVMSVSPTSMVSQSTAPSPSVSPAPASSSVVVASSV